MPHGRTEMQEWAQDCARLWSCMYCTSRAGSAHSTAPHSQHCRDQLHTRSATLTTQQSLARHTTRRCTHDAAEAAILRPCLVKRCGSLSRVQCLLGIKGCYTAWHPQWAEYRVPGISRGRAGPAYHHPRLSAWRISLPLLPCLGSVGLMALIPSGPSTRGHG